MRRKHSQEKGNFAPLGKGLGNTMVVKGLMSGLILAVFLAGPLLAADLATEAREAVENERYEEARDLYIQLSEENAWNVDYLLWVATLSDWLQDSVTATQYYDRSLALEPLNVEALVGKAYALMRQQEFQSALEPLSMARLVAPNNTDVLLALARAHYYQGNAQSAREYVAQALSLDPENPEAEQLTALFSPSRPLLVRFGYGNDRYSAVSPSQMGSLSVGYVGKRGRISGHYERWHEFDEKVDLGGFSFNQRFGNGLWLRADAMLAAGATLSAQEDYAAGMAWSLPGGLVMGADYRYLRFQFDTTHVVAPLLEYYFEDPIWIRAMFFKSWTEFEPTASLGNNESFRVHYYQQVAHPVVFNFGFAHGNETFSALPQDRLATFDSLRTLERLRLAADLLDVSLRTIDQLRREGLLDDALRTIDPLADLEASTYSGGVDFKLSPAVSLDLNFSYQDRTDGSGQSTFGVGLTIRK
jgi:YaiO family outer membrane protein